MRKHSTIDSVAEVGNILTSVEAKIQALAGRFLMRGAERRVFLGLSPCLWAAIYPYIFISSWHVAVPVSPFYRYVSPYCMKALTLMTLFRLNSLCEGPQFCEAVFCEVLELEVSTHEF